MKYYTDDELVELVRTMGESKESYEWIADKIAQRFELKDKQLKFAQQRVNVAADYIGHNVINELLEEQY